MKYIGKGHALELISNYIKDRRQVVKIGNSTSSVKDLLYGVPQGSVLGPILFLLYINDITSVVEHCRTTMYADDTSIYYTSYHASNIQNALNKDLSKLRDWFDFNKLKLNISKSSFMIMKSGRNRRPADVNVFIGGKTITQENEIKILGVTVDKNLTFTTHVKNLKKNLKYCLRAFTRAVRYIHQDTAKILYNSAIASRLNYCDVVWSPEGTTLQHSIQVIQNMAARRILGVNSRHSSKPLLQELGWIDLKNKRDLHKLVLFKKILKERNPTSLIEELETYRRRNERTSRSNPDNLIIKCCKTNYGKRTFFNNTIRKWNMLPLSIRDTASVKSFKERLHAHMLRGTTNSNTPVLS